ncbi:hypothetical protein FRB94_011482 [Tulasnella sp. JGI-2019a]|nr:hypothetical protein FRB94_011482 [Tulasnella sp. JGI-2019a]KAG9003225.1 hypothetical protein FRB93_011137 [Tulasnella sp. JGI-2019a]
MPYNLNLAQLQIYDDRTLPQRAKPGSKGDIIELPPELLLLPLDYLDRHDLCNLSQTCSALHRLVSSYWVRYNRLNPHPSLSLHLARSTRWTGLDVARYDHLSDQTWTRRSFNSVSLPPTVKFHGGGGIPRPYMAISETRLIVFAGRELESIRWTADGGYIREGVGSWKSPAGGSHHLEIPDDSNIPVTGRAAMDITGAAFVPDGGKDETICLATADGQLVRCALSFNPPSHSTDVHRKAKKTPKLGSIDVVEVAHLPHPVGTSITTLASSGNTLLTLASKVSQPSSAVSLSTDNPTSSLSTRETLVSLYTASDYDSQGTVSRLTLPGKPTSAHVSIPGAYVAIGTSQRYVRRTAAVDSFGDTTTSLQPTTVAQAPLSIYAIAPDGLSDAPLRSLTTIHAVSPTPYAICSPCPSSPAGPSPYLLLSGWYDSHVHLHDLRTSEPKPVMSWHDPWLDDPVYSLSSCTTNIVAGMGQHGIVAIFDVRIKSPLSTNNAGRIGFSAYSPEGDGSPVYAIHAEASRIWGLSRGLFLLDFGPSDVCSRGRELFYNHTVRYITQS